jgi:hypothetical protein
MSLKMSHTMIKFLHHTKGVAAVEFALILPFMLILFFGSNEVTQAIMAARKLETAVRVITDLTGQYSVLKETDSDEIFAAANEVINPYDTKKFSIVLSGVAIDETGKTKVVWSIANDGSTPKGCGDVIKVPEAIKPPKGTKGFALVGDGIYDYVPSSLFVMKTGIKLTHNLPWLARSRGAITLENPQCK